MTNIARLFISTLIFLPLAVSGCRGDFAPPRDTVVVAIGAQPLTLDPRYAMDATGTRVDALIFSGLVRMGEKFEAVPDAAEKWTYKNHVFTFWLKRDLQFHNGRAVTADDVDFSFRYYLDKNGVFASMLKTFKNFHVDTKDGGIVVTVGVNNYSDNFLISEMPTVKILPKKEIEEQGVDFNQSLIGTGPYRFVRQTLNEIRLKSVRAKTENLVFKVIRDDLTRYQKMLKGEVDLVLNDMPADKIEAFERRPENFQVISSPALSMNYIVLNLKDPLLKQKDVRLALSQALQRNEIIKYKLKSLAQEATSVLTPQNPYFNSTLKNPTFDLKAAQKIVARLGVKNQTLILKTSNTPSALDTGRVLANQFSRSGLNVKVESFEWGTFYDDVKKGNFQMATMKWVGVVDPDIYRLAFDSKEVPPGRNRGAYSNAKVDDLLEKGRGEEDIRKRRRIYAQIQSLVHADLAVIPLWYETQITIARRSVQNFKPVMSGDYWPLTEVTKK